MAKIELERVSRIARCVVPFVPSAGITAYGIEEIISGAATKNSERILGGAACTWIGLNTAVMIRSMISITESISGIRESLQHMEETIVYGVLLLDQRIDQRFQLLEEHIQDRFDLLEEHITQHHQLSPPERQEIIEGESQEIKELPSSINHE